MPVRTCLFCRQAIDKSLLVRFVSCGGALTADLEGREPGRGAYTCRSRVCIEGALKRKGAFSRALKTQLTMPETEWAERLIKDIGA
ncbi:MAG: hypothetical protein A2W38_00510 [Deltaproteobacteria bacterium RBG_19FT_COMBO_58_16]|nr:MAG: hypothetical protein A2W38_00510 [Deltaproteobacteria bacterium RBG_19FT_COMBO_58_16]